MCGHWCWKKNKGILTFYFKHFVLDTFKQSTNYWFLYSTEFSQSKHSLLCKPTSRRTVLRITSIYRPSTMSMPFAYYVAHAILKTILWVKCYCFCHIRCITHSGPPGRGRKWDPSRGESGSWACILSSTHFFPP